MATDHSLLSVKFRSFTLVVTAHQNFATAECTRRIDRRLTEETDSITQQFYSAANTGITGCVD